MDILSTHKPTVLNSMSPPIQVGRYLLKIERKISEGGFGFVYEAYDVNTRQRVALKQMNVHDKDSQRLI